MPPKNITAIKEVLEKINRNRGLSFKEIMKDKKLKISDSLLRDVLKKLEEEGEVIKKIEMRDQDHMPNPVYYARLT